jgi:hypothetical protein
VKPEIVVQRVLEFAVSQYGKFLATRSVARTARENLEARIVAYGPATLVAVRFDEVDAMTISFADEFLGRFYAALAAGDVAASGVELSGLNEETRETAAVCLERRDLVGAAVRDGTATLLGKIDNLQTTYEAARSVGTFRAAEIATTLGITPQNANNRLKKLVEAGAM